MGVSIPELSEKGAAIIGDTAVIADLHLGIESALEEKGVAIPPMQVDWLIESVIELVEEHSLSRIVVAGDLKHEFSRNVPGEWRDVRKFIESVRGVAELEVVRGNHDNYLAAILEKYGIGLSEKVYVGEYAVIHGHIECEDSKIIMGHEHPSIKVKHGGAVYSFRCFLHAVNAKQEVWVLPVFSPLFTGSNVLEGTFISPIMKRFEDGEVDVYAIEDGVYYMGNLKVLAELL